MDALREWGGSVLFLLARLCFDTACLTFLLTLYLPTKLVKYLMSKKSSTVKEFKNILITGASSGIGAELARSYAAQGRSLALIAYRDNTNLETVAEFCRNKGAKVATFDQNVVEEGPMEKLLLEFDSQYPLDLVIANAGITPRFDGILESRDVIKVNLLGMLNTVLPAVQQMKARKKGQIALVSSLGGYGPASSKFMLPYVSSKTAVRIYGEGLRALLEEDGIGVTVVCPGFTKSKITDYVIEHGCKLYSLWSERVAVQTIMKGIRVNASEVAFPLHLYILTRLTGNLPPWLKEITSKVMLHNDPFRPMDFLEKP